MNYRYEKLSVDAFRSESESIESRGWQINYLSFCLPQNKHKAPLVLIGGAFQVFHSFVGDVKAYLPEFPVIIVALPGQSSNQDEKDASVLSLSDYADLLADFCTQNKLKKIQLAGFSFGSLIAYHFSYKYERLLESVILVGCSIEMRHGLRQLLKTGAEQMQPLLSEKIGDAIAQTLFNVDFHEKTGLSLKLVDRLADSVKKLSHKDLADYRANSHRLLNENVPKRQMEVKALIMTARYDHFIQPHESLAVSKLFPNGTFALIENGDHLVPLTSPKLVYRSILAFLRDTSIVSDGVVVGTQAKKVSLRRRKLERILTRPLKVQISNVFGIKIEGILQDLNSQGAAIQLDPALNLDLEGEGIWQLECDEWESPLRGYLEVKASRASMIFYRDSFQFYDHINAIMKVAV